MFTKTEELFLTELREAGSAGCSRAQLGHLCRRPTDQENHWYVSNVVDVHMKNLRRKMFLTGERIESVRGFGYKLIAA